jgi:hypothetical protein
MAPVTEDIAAPETSVFVKSRFSRITGKSGGTANVAKNAKKKLIELTWKLK